MDQKNGTVRNYVWNVLGESSKYKTESQDIERRLIYTKYKWTKY